MLCAASAFKGYAIEATDGQIGKVHDLLFDDQSWKIRWVVVDTGNWLPGRRILLHPSAVRHVDYERLLLPVALTKAQVQGSPDIGTDEPVSGQMERHLFSYYGWDPYWGPSYFGSGAIASPLSPPPYFGAAGVTEAERDDPIPDPGDHHLRSIAAVTGYHLHATDGSIGHVENFLIDSGSWGIRYLVVDTRNWWPGQQVLISPYAVREIEWADRLIRLDVDRAKVKTSPTWDAARAVDRAYEQQLHGHYNWPGYGV